MKERVQETGVPALAAAKERLAALLAPLDGEAKKALLLLLLAATE